MQHTFPSFDLDWKTFAKVIHVSYERECSVFFCIVYHPCGMRSSSVLGLRAVVDSTGFSLLVKPVFVLDGSQNRKLRVDSNCKNQICRLSLLEN